MSNSYTIIIPTSKRHDFLRRSLAYLQSHFCKAPILIADSSPDNFDISSFEHLDITYNNDTTSDLYDRLRNAVDAIKTPYAIFLGDDDFLNFRVVEQCCAYLDKNPDYCVADGTEIRFTFRSGPIEIITHHQPSLRQDNVAQRLISHGTTYWPTFYALHRKETLRNGLTSAINLPDHGYLIQELAASMTIIAQGKFHHIDDVMMTRQVWHGQSTQTVWWHDMVRDNDFAKARQDSIKQIAQYSSINAATQGFDAYTKRFYNENRMKVIKNAARVIIPAKVRALLYKTLPSNPPTQYDLGDITIWIEQYPDGMPLTPSKLAS